MKKILYPVVLLIGICFSSACEKSQDSDGNSDDILYVSVMPSQTKASLSDSYGVQWQVGETAAIVAAGGAPIESTALTESDMTNNAWQATFGFDAEVGTYRLFHPYSAESSYGAYKFNVPAEQIQHEAGMMNAGYVCLVAEDDVTLSDAEIASVNYNVAGTIMKFLIFGGAADEKIMSVEFYDGGWEETEVNQISGVITAANDGSVETTPDACYVKVSLEEYADASVASKELAEGIYMSVLPSVLNKPKYTVYTTTTKYEFYSQNESYELMNGAMHTVSLNLSSTNEKLVKTDWEYGEDWFDSSEETKVTMKSGTDVELSLDGESVTYTFDAWVSGNDISYGKVMVYDGSWNELDEFKTDGYAYSYPNFYTNPTRTTFDVTFTEVGNYIVYLNVLDEKGTWLEEGKANVKVVDPNAAKDTTPPTVVLNSPTTASVGEDYALSITFSDNVGFEGLWPKVQLALASPWTSLLEEYPAVTGSSYTFEKTVKFETAGTYQLWIGTIKDSSGNVAEFDVNNAFATITVTEAAE